MGKETEKVQRDSWLKNYFERVFVSCTVLLIAAIATLFLQVQSNGQAIEELQLERERQKENTYLLFEIARGNKVQIEGFQGMSKAEFAALRRDVERALNKLDALNEKIK